VNGQHLISKHSTMTNNELLHASLLDIVFDNRNKEYGAYALRKEYNQRLLVSLGIGTCVIFFVVLVNALNENQPSGRGNRLDKNEVTITSVVIPPDEKIKKPEPPVAKPAPEPVQPKAVEPVAAVDFPVIAIVPDNEADKKLVATQAEMLNKQIATGDADGKEYTGEVVPQITVVSSNGPDKEVIPANRPIIPNSNPEFPGGQEALLKFLSRHLDTPGELESGEKKMVRARFKVDIDGSVSLVEIVQTGGSLFDKEVIRVCKKMPRWKPAIQNGEAVPTSYVLPVTFIGVDQ
jgi:periplasmic protein TonB